MSLGLMLKTYQVKRAEIHEANFFYLRQLSSIIITFYVATSAAGSKFVFIQSMTYTLN